MTGHFLLAVSAFTFGMTGGSLAGEPPIGFSSIAFLPVAPSPRAMPLERPAFRLGTSALPCISFASFGDCRLSPFPAACWAQIATPQYPEPVVILH